jgi:hypothetical protein
MSRIPDIGKRKGLKAETVTVHYSGESGWVAKSVARQLATAVLWVRIQTSLKNHKMGDISEGVADTL